MYLSELKLENFRIFEESKAIFIPGLNLLVGENDAGKSAIIDAIKLVLGTHSNDWTRIEDSDFHGDSNSLAITCVFANLTESEAAFFIEWLSFDDKNKFYLKLTLRAKKIDGIKPAVTIYAGADEDSGVLQGEAREKLRVTYLKPLRDAEFELTPKKNSRFSQILDSFHAFRDKKGHPLVEIMKDANEKIKDYFNDSSDGGIVQSMINDDYLKHFSLAHNPLSSKIDISGNKLRSILEKLELRILNKQLNENLGLGSNNLLFIAAELLLLKKEDEYSGLKLALVEEIEAHLHPQSQLNLIEFLERESQRLGFQSIITTHSNILASKIDINKLTICKAGKVFPLQEDYTELLPGDYHFLRRFLDATRSNLFFANGVIMVEGDAENLLLPTLAELIDRPLFKYGVSIVNVTSTALLRYSKIFRRKNKSLMGIPVACIADRDIPPKEAGEYKYTLQSGKNKGQERVLVDRKTEDDYDIEDLALIEKKICDKYTGGDVKVFYTSTWTLEYEIAKSVLRKYLHRAVCHALETSDLETVLSDEDTNHLYDKADNEIETWVKSGDSIDKIAVAIYAPLVRKQASKAVTAQLFATLLQDNKKLIDAAEVRSDIYLKYLVDAIDYVTLNATND